MPFYEPAVRVQSLTNIAPVDEPQDPSTGETLAAAFRSENIVGSYIASRGMADPYVIEQGFNAIDYVKDDADFAPHVGRFSGIFNQKAADALKLKIKQENTDRRTIDAAGVNGVIASLAAGVFDLPTLLPVGGGVAYAGRGLLGTATGAAIGAGIGASVSETGLQLTQQTRTGEETIYNIGGSILLGGALGTLAGRYLSSAEMSGLSRKIEGQPKAFEEANEAVWGRGSPSGAAQSAGAAAVDRGPLQLKDEALIKKMWGIRSQDPLIRSQLSDFDATRQTVRQLAETPLEYADNAKGVATEIGGSVETRMKMWQAPLADAVQEFDTIYAGYFHNAPDPTSWQRRLAPMRSEMQRVTGGDKLTYKQFKEEVGKAAYSGDTHAIPEVEAAAGVYRRVDEAMKHAAIDAGLLPPDIKVAKDASHVFRLYNKDKISAYRSKWGQILHDHVSAGQVTAANKLQEMEAANMAVGVQKAAASLAAADERLQSVIKRGSEARDVLDNRIANLEARDYYNSATVKMDDARQKTLDRVTELRSEYKSARAMYEKAAAEMDEVQKTFDDLPSDVKKSKRVQMALDYHKKSSDLLSKKSEVARLREKQLEYTLSKQVAKADEIDIRISKIEPDLIRLQKSTDKLKEIFAKIGKGNVNEIDELATFSRLLPDEIQEIVDEITDNILGNADGRVPYDSIVSGPRGTLKSRTLKIESQKIQEFLNTDIEEVLHAQIRTMSADVEIANKFGSVDMAEQIRKIHDEASNKIAAVDGALGKDGKPLTPEAKAKERQRLEKERKAAVRDIEGIRDRLRGQYALPSNPDGLVLRAGRVARNLNYMRLLGGMTLSAFPDAAGVILKHGLTSTFKDGFVPMVKSWRSFKAAAGEIKAAGTALDMVLDSRAMSMADVSDDFGRGSKFERGLKSLNSRFGVVSLMAPWNASMKQFSGVIVMNNVIRSAQRVAKGEATAKELRKLAAGGINADLAERISKQFAKYGDKQGDVFLAKAGDWDDRLAREAIRTAVVRDVDRIIVTPGQDKPLWMSTELGKTIGQFKSFQVSAAQRILLSGIQQRDADVLAGLITSMGLGALTYWAKTVAAGREVSDDPMVWATNAVDWSGATGWFMEVNGLVEKATRGRIGASALSGEQMSRFQSRNVLGSFLGPSTGAVSDIFQVSGSIFAGDTTKSDLRNATHLLPFRNLFYVRRLFDEIESSAGDTMNLPDTRKK